MNAKSEVEGTWVGTSMSLDLMFYMYCPVHVLAPPAAIGEVVPR